MGIRVLMNVGVALAVAGQPAGQDKRAAELIAKAVEAFGGAAAVDAVTGLEVRTRGTRHVQGNTIEVTTTTRYFYPDRYQQELALPMGVMKTVVGPDSAFIVAGEGALPLPDVERKSLIRLMHRHPVALLRARRAPGFSATMAGTANVGGKPVELVKVTREGDTITLGIDPVTGQVLQTSYESAPGGLAPAGTLVVTYADYRPAGPLRYPHSSAGTLSGQPAFEARVDSVVVNPKLDQALFQQPPAHTMFPGERDPLPSPSPSAAPSPAAPSPAPSPTPTPKE